MAAKRSQPTHRDEGKANVIAATLRLLDTTAPKDITLRDIARESGHGNRLIIEWFGGKAGSQYQFQKMLFSDLGSGFGVKGLFKDPDIQESYKKYADIAMFEKQQLLARKKDVIARWFGEWDEVNSTAWQSAILGKSSVAAALKKSSDTWNDLRKS